MNYWERRAAVRQAVYDRDAEQVIRQLQTAYRRAGEDIKMDVLSIFNNFREYFKLPKEDALKMLKSPAPPEVLKRLQMMSAALPDGREKLRIQAELSAPAYAHRISRLAAMQESARIRMAEVANVEIAADTRGLAKAADNAYMRTLYDVQRSSGFVFTTVGFDVKRSKQIIAQNWSGVHFSERVWKNTRQTAENVGIALQEMLVQGKASSTTYQKILSDVVDEQMNKAGFAANRLLRTEFNHVTGEAEMESYQDSDVEKYRYIAVLDGKTSEICRDLDGKVFPVSERKVGVNMHPMHPWCRSRTAPVLDSVVLSQHTRWSRDPVTGKEEKIPANITYREWEKRWKAKMEEASSLKRKLKKQLK